jgi:superfamily II DNA or RNA helicase
MSARVFSKPSISSSVLPRRKPIATKSPNAAKPTSAQNIETILTEEYKSQIMENAYLGKKGFTIPKSILTKQDEAFLKKDLYLAPVSHGVSYGAAEAAFPVYRENTNKMYIPRFYGISRYGLPTKSEIDAGDDISVSFTKPLRDYQEKIVQIYVQHVRKPIASGDDSGVQGGGAILEVPCGRGKCLAKNTEIIMFDGTIKYVQDVVVGDLLMGDDSTPRKVLSLASGREMMYKISAISPNAHTLPDSYVVNKSHILSLRNDQTGEVMDISVPDYFRYLQRHGGQSAYKGYRVPLTFPHTEPEIDPYSVGVWLCQNHRERNAGNTIAPKIYIPPAFLAKYQLDKELHIPHHYLCNSRDVQLRIFAGIIDTIQPEYDGEYYEFAISSPRLLRDVVFLARSLGFAAELLPNEQMRVFIHPKTLNYDFQIERMGVDDYYGFEIDGNRRFVLGNFAVTHNTIMALNIVSVLQKKTLIIVHKEFLMNQWIERIADFIPDARVGKIQGAVFDVEGKDIVIGMIQTLYDREFPPNAFASFGLTIIDEVHRIGSEQFSKTLLRVITPYMLGISATVDRKDGLTRVLNMFIGEKIYTEERENDDPVCVRAVEFVSTDPEFNEVVYDYRGNPQYSTMISKLCAFNRRNDFIVRIISDLVEENPENQIMILAHQRGILTYMYDAIQHRKIASVGFYVGGMKQTDLQTTESKQIVLATYAMAAEALDIKTLSTLVMITPKTDIIQSVGRILRVKHENPIIVDIVDKHDVFQKQWIQRRRFYKKCNYRIRQIESPQYTGMAIDWDADRTWRRVFEPSAQSPNALFACNMAGASIGDDDDDDEPAKPLSSRKCMITLEDCSV